jgi:hypothetical protein
MADPRHEPKMFNPEDGECIYIRNNGMHDVLSNKTILRAIIPLTAIPCRTVNYHLE